MKATAIGFCIAAGLGFAVTLGAQSQTGALKPGEIAVTGCLQKSADGMFALTNAQVDPAASGLPGASASAATGSGSTATTGTTGSSASASTKPMTYSLQAGTADLATHVGHKVQITGKPEMSGSGAAGGSTSAPSSGAAGAPQGGSSSSSSSAANPKLDVSAVKMIATTCP